MSHQKWFWTKVCLCVAGKIAMTTTVALADPIAPASLPVQNSAFPSLPGLASTTGEFGTGEGLSGNVGEVTLNDLAGRLADELSLALKELATSQEQPAGPRRFARARTGDCVNPAARRVKQALEESEELIEYVDESTANSANNIW